MYLVGPGPPEEGEIWMGVEGHPRAHLTCRREIDIPNLIQYVTAAMWPSTVSTAATCFFLVPRASLVVRGHGSLNFPGSCATA